jgi:hypothetical protein
MFRERALSYFLLATEISALPALNKLYPISSLYDLQKMALSRFLSSKICITVKVGLIYFNFNKQDSLHVASCLLSLTRFLAENLD